MPADATTSTNAPTTRVRLSADQLKPISVGLHDLVEENNFLRATGWLRRHPNLPDQYGRFNCHKAPTDEQMNSILSAHAKIQPRVETGGIIRLDHRELAACYLAVSHAKRLVNRKHAQAWAPDYKAAARRLHAFLEKYRKRAIKELPASSQKPERRKIVGELREVKQRLAPSVAVRKKHPFERRHARELVDKAQRLAVAGLNMKGFEVPSDPRSLRTLVRARLRNFARKKRKTNDENVVFERDIFLSDEISAALMLADYIIKHSPTLVRRSAPKDNTRQHIRSTRVEVPSSGVSVTHPQAAELPERAVLPKEIPACVRVACSELERLTDEDWEGQNAWSTMSRAAQVAAVAKAKKDGQGQLSNRHIGRILGIDDKTVARMLKETRFPKDVRTQVLRGNKSVNQALKEAGDPVYQQNKRMEREQRDGSVSDDLAEKAVAYVLERDSVSWVARQIVRRAKELAADESSEWLRRQVPEVDVDRAMAASRSVQANGELEYLDIETAAMRLEWWLVRVAPERVIHTAALDKAFRSPPSRGVWGSIS